jgi:hypothetical protein
MASSLNLIGAINHCYTLEASQTRLIGEDDDTIQLYKTRCPAEREIERVCLSFSYSYFGIWKYLLEVLEPATLYTTTMST